MVKVLLVSLAILLIATFPATWLLMLFLGNIDTNLSYWGTLPLGILVSTLLGGVSARSQTYA
jgi:MFS-type transporter involved in bile tolerance (Atg22 family)